MKMIPNLSQDWIRKLQDELKAKKRVNVPCMTTSTAGVSFNSPPATDRAGFEEGEQIVEEYDVENHLKIA